MKNYNRSYLYNNNRVIDLDPVGNLFTTTRPIEEVIEQLNNTKNDIILGRCWSAVTTGLAILCIILYLGLVHQYSANAISIIATIFGTLVIWSSISLSYIFCKTNAIAELNEKIIFCSKLLKNKISFPLDYDDFYDDFSVIGSIILPKSGSKCDAIFSHFSDNKPADNIYSSPIGVPIISNIIRIDTNDNPKSAFKLDFYFQNPDEVIWFKLRFL